jgi:hypothetical protein
VSPPDHSIEPIAVSAETPAACLPSNFASGTLPADWSDTMMSTLLFRRTLTAGLGLAIALATIPLAASTRLGAGEVKVTVKYNGKGTVDGNHRLWIWLFDTPEISAGGIPIAEMSLDANGTSATFANVAQEKVWIAIAFDEHGGFGGSAPPPSGSPVTVYAEKGAPAGVTPGPDAAVSVAFDDTRRMP